MAQPEGLINDTAIASKGSRAVYPKPEGIPSDIQPGQILIYAGDGVFLPSDLPTPGIGGVLISTPYRTSTSATPGAGRCHFVTDPENTDPNTLILNYIDDDGIDISNVAIALIDVGDHTIVQQNSDANVSVTFTISAITDQPSLGQISFTLTPLLGEGSSGSDFGNNTNVIAIFTDQTP